MASLGNWALPRRTPTSDSRNQQQQAMSYAQNPQQEPSRQPSHSQQMNRSIYSVVEPSGNRRPSTASYNGVMVDPGLQEVTSTAHGQSSHSIDNDSSRIHGQPSTPLSAHLSAMGNGQLAPADHAGSRRTSQQGLHESSRQPPTLSMGGQDVLMQNMVMPNSQANSTDNARPNPSLGTMGTAGLRTMPSTQQYPQFQRPQQRAEQFHLLQNSWEGDSATRRTSNEHPHLNVNRRTAFKNVPPLGVDGNHPASIPDARQRTSQSSGHTNVLQQLSATSPTSATNAISHANHPGPQAGAAAGSVSRETTTSPQWQLSHLSNRLDQLAKTQSEMLAYLHVELTRRKEWEEQLLKELRQRREQTSTTRTSQGSAGLPDARWNSMGRNSFPGNPMELVVNPAFTGNNNVPMPNAQASYTPWSHPQQSPQISNNGNPAVFNPLGQPPTRQTMESTNHYPISTPQSSHPQNLSAMTMGMSSLNGYTHEGDQKQDRRGTVTAMPAEVAHSIPSQAELNQIGLTSLPSLPPYVETDNTAAAPITSEEVERSKRKRKADGEASAERPSKKLEVDERGVVIMMSGNTKLKEKPTKIQSVVRKTLYGSMGIADVADAKDMPIYEEGMQPPDGSGAWRFGNLRFDWNATLRRSSHNVAMRDIVLKHIISVRAEYDEIPDSEFEPVRLEPAFDQAFGTWKGKYQGKRPGGIRRGLPSDKNSPKAKQNGETDANGQGEEEGTLD